jgi:hypothetical protein
VPVQPRPRPALITDSSLKVRRPKRFDVHQTDQGQIPAISIHAARIVERSIASSQRLGCLTGAPSWSRRPSHAAQPSPGLRTPQRMRCPSTTPHERHGLQAVHHQQGALLFKVCIPAQTVDLRWAPAVRGR